MCSSSSAASLIDPRGGRVTRGTILARDGEEVDTLLVLKLGGSAHSQAGRQAGERVERGREGVWTWTGPLADRFA